MDWEKERKKALKAFLQNEYWREYYENAPSDTCKEYIELGFLWSKYARNGDENDRPPRFKGELDINDLQYLHDHEGNNRMKYNYKKKIDALKAKG